MSETSFFDPTADFITRILPNGLSAHASEWKKRNWVQAEIIVHSGAGMDMPEHSGLMHFLEHLVAENIPKTTKEELEGIFKLWGGQPRLGSTDYSSTKYGFKISASPHKLETMLNIFGRMLLEGKMTKKIERERNIILQEYNEYHPSLKQRRVGMAARQNIFEGTSFADYVDPLGTPKHIRSFTAADLQSAYDQYYVPANISIVMIGGLDTEMMFEILEKSSLSVFKEGQKAVLPKAPDKLIIPKTQKMSLKSTELYLEKREQAHYVAKWSYPAETNLQHLEIFNAVLREMLERELREKDGSTYGVRCEDSRFGNFGEYEIETQIDPDMVENIEEMVQKSIERIRLQKELNTFEQTQRFLSVNRTMTDFCGESLYEAIAGDLAKHGRIVTLSEEHINLLRVTMDDVSNIASTLSPERQFSVMVRP